MNRQFHGFNSPSILCALFLAAVVLSVGCDLGTYNKRFKERNNPPAAKKVKKGDAADKGGRESDS